MHIVIIFSHIGPYHLARLKAAYAVFEGVGCRLTAIQSIAQTKDHPWGDVLQTEGISLKTLLPAKTLAGKSLNLHPESPEAVAALGPCLELVQPDVVVIPGWGFPLSRAALGWCRNHQVPTVLMSESKWDDERRVWWKEYLKSWLYVRKYAAALVGGPTHKEYLVNLGISPERIFFGYDIVDNSHFTREFRVKMYFGWSRHLSATVKRLVKNKPGL